MPISLRLLIHNVEDGLALTLRCLGKSLCCFLVLVPLAGAQSLVSVPDHPDVFAFRSYLPQGQGGASTKPKKVKVARPRMEGSFTGGYIEDAVVRTQIRVRFDAEFSVEDPDRAEFFYGKCACYRGLPSTNPAYDPNAPGPGPGIAARLNAREVHVNVEYAPLQRLSFFADLPERSLQYTATVGGKMDNATGFGDFVAGLKFALVASERTYLTFEFSAFTPTGDASQGLGTNHYSVQPLLLLNHRLGEHMTLLGQFGDFHPLAGSAGYPTASSPNAFAGDVLEYGLGLGYRFETAPEISITPLLEFVGWHVFDGYYTSATAAVQGTLPELSAAGVNIVNVKAGFRISFHQHHSVYLGYGEALTNSRWYKEILRLEYRFLF
jgi:hypothetical protein